MLIRSVIIRSLGPVGRVLFLNNDLRVIQKRTDLSVLARSLTSLKLNESERYCSINKLELNQEIAKLNLRGNYLDKSVAHILKKDIQVPEVPLMLNKKFRKLNVLNLSVIQRFKKIPDNVKFGRWTQQDFQLIRTNMDSLVAATRAKKNKDKFLKLQTVQI